MREGFMEVMKGRCRMAVHQGSWTKEATEEESGSLGNLEWGWDAVAFLR